jgi:hypothetical protein
MLPIARIVNGGRKFSETPISAGRAIQGRIHRHAPEATMIRIANSPAEFDAICAALPLGSVVVEAEACASALYGLRRRWWIGSGRCGGPARATVA